MVRAQAWPGDRSALRNTPLIVWTFDPVTATVNGTPVPLSRVQHILDAAGFTWGSGGAPTLSRDELVREFAEHMLAVAESDEIHLRRVTWKAIGKAMGIGEDGVLYRRKRAVQAKPEITLPEVIEAASSLRFSRGDNESQA